MGCGHAGASCGVGGVDDVVREWGGKGASIRGGCGGMTRSELEELWRTKPLQFWGHVACWDEEGLARPGVSLSPECGADVKAFRNLIKKINSRDGPKQRAAG